MTTMNHAIKAILFDLDGTLLDTAPDLLLAINQIRRERQLPELELSEFRKHIYAGSRSILKFAFDLNVADEEFEPIKQQFFHCYHELFTTHTEFYPNMLDVLEDIEQRQIPWGIVTNKPGFLAIPLLEHFELHTRSQCLIAGDTLTNRKPHPEPLLHAVASMNVLPEHCLYIGDTETDAIAATAANMTSISMSYGYHKPGSDIQQWPTHAILDSAKQIIPWLNEHEVGDAIKAK